MLTALEENCEENGNGIQTLFWMTIDWPDQIRSSGQTKRPWFHYALWLQVCDDTADVCQSISAFWGSQLLQTTIDDRWIVFLNPSNCWPGSQFVQFFRYLNRINKSYFFPLFWGSTDFLRVNMSSSDLRASLEQKHIGWQASESVIPALIGVILTSKFF